jgi:hypothetical protein
MGKTQELEGYASASHFDFIFKSLSFLSGDTNNVVFALCFVYMEISVMSTTTL